MLAIGIAEGGRLRRDVPRDRALTHEDVELPEGRAVIDLWREQAHLRRADDRRSGPGTPRG